MLGKCLADNMVASESGYFRMAANKTEDSISYREMEDETHIVSARMVYVYNRLR